jgi:hypothetical protein
LEKQRREAFARNDAINFAERSSSLPATHILREFAALQYVCSNFVLRLKKKLACDAHGFEALI